MKSIETKFAEAMDALKKANRLKVFEEKTKDLKNATIEVKLNAAEAVLKDVGVVREAAPVRKHNGAADNFIENNPFRPLEEFRESANNFSAGYTKETTDHCAKGDKVLFDGLLKLGKITEAEHKKLTSDKPEGYSQLTEQKQKDFDFCRAVGLSEAQAFEFVRGPKDFKEVSRR